MWCLVVVLILSHCQLFLVQVTVTGNKYTGSALWLQMTQRVDMQLLNINASMLLLKVSLAHLVEQGFTSGNHIPKVESFSGDASVQVL